MAEKFSIALLLVLMIGDDLNTMTIYPTTDKTVRECVSEAHFLNDRLKEIRIALNEAEDDDQEEAAKRLLRGHPKLRWVNRSQVELGMAEYRCEVTTLVRY